MNEQVPRPDAHGEEVQGALGRVTAALLDILQRIEELERRALQGHEKERVCTQCGALFRPVPRLDRLCGICQGRERTRAEERPPPRAGGGALTWP